MPNHHMKGQPATSTYVREKGGVKKDSNRETPCSIAITINISNFKGPARHVENRP